MSLVLIWMRAGICHRKKPACVHRWGGICSHSVGMKDGGLGKKGLPAAGRVTACWLARQLLSGPGTLTAWHRGAMSCCQGRPADHCSGRWAHRAPTHSPCQVLSSSGFPFLCCLFWQYFGISMWLRYVIKKGVGARTSLSTVGRKNVNANCRLDYDI